MTDKNADKPRRDEDKNADAVKDLGRKPIDEKDAEQVKGGLTQKSGIKY